MTLRFSPHTIVRNINEDRFLIYQIVTRKGVLINHVSLAAINVFLINQSATIETLYLKDISTFSLSRSLLDNPNGLLDESYFLANLDSKDFIQALDDLKKLSILASDDSYLDKLGKKLNLFDKDHTGNFHQQIGEYVLRNKDINAEMWWITQKFSEDYKSTTDTPYKWVQEIFMHEQFSESNIAGKKVLDFGSGIGYYSRFFHDLGGDVTGVDPSENYINIAKEEFAKKDEINFIKASFEKISDFEMFEDKYDMIFLSDVFLYYFEPYKKMELTPVILLQELNKILNKDGKIFILDPHGIFHLQPWFNRNKPFLMAVEYANRKYRVTPNLEEVSIAAEKAGLVISKIREVKYKGTDIDKMFYAEFPFWWFFELKKAI
jgi:SAM-dependent methyltransferase